MSAVQNVTPSTVSETNITIQDSDKADAAAIHRKQVDNSSGQLSNTSKKNPPKELCNLKSVQQVDKTDRKFT